MGKRAQLGATIFFLCAILCFRRTPVQFKLILAFEGDFKQGQQTLIGLAIFSIAGHQGRHFYGSAPKAHEFTGLVIVVGQTVDQNERSPAVEPGYPHGKVAKCTPFNQATLKRTMKLFVIFRCALEKVGEWFSIEVITRASEKSGET